MNDEDRLFLELRDVLEKHGLKPAEVRPCYDCRGELVDIKILDLREMDRPQGRYYGVNYV